MQQKDNIIRLNEQEFNALIRESVVQVLNEGGFGDLARKVGKGVGKAALYGALGAGSLYALDKGLDNQDRYERNINKQSAVMQGPTEDEVDNWIADHEMEDTPQNREAAWNAMRNESKQSIMIAKIIREEISKVL